MHDADHDCPVKSDLEELLFPVDLLLSLSTLSLNLLSLPFFSFH